MEVLEQKRRNWKRKTHAHKTNQMQYSVQSFCTNTRMCALHSEGEGIDGKKRWKNLERRKCSEKMRKKLQKSG